MTKWVVYDDFLTYLSGLGRSSETLRLYRWALDQLPDPSIVEAQEVVALYAGLRQRYSSVSVANVDKAWRVFYSWLAWRELWPNIMERVPKPRPPRSTPRVFSRPELTAIVGAAKTQRDAALVAFFLGTGARIGEVANLRWPNIALGTVRIHGKTGWRTVPLPKKAQSLLHNLGDGEHVWAGLRGPLGYAGVKQAILRIIRDAGINGARASPHTFRHTFATEYLRLGGEVHKLQRYLGHFSLAQTMIYVHLLEAGGVEDHTPLQLVEFADYLPPLIAV